jgi:hypothetical protein
VRVDVSAQISVPVDFIDLPLHWGGLGFLALDSITVTGLRTESSPTPIWIHLNQADKRGTLHIQTIADGVTLPPATGPIASLWFTPTGGTWRTEVNEITVASYVDGYHSYALDFATIRGSYAPEVISGLVTVCGPGECCCDNRVGDVNGSGEDEPTIGDVSVLIDAKFISSDPDLISCLAEADINQSGGEQPTADDITIGDISYLIDYLFVTGSGLGLADCM